MESVTDYCSQPLPPPGRIEEIPIASGDDAPGVMLRRLRKEAAVADQREKETCTECPCADEVRRQSESEDHTAHHDEEEVPAPISVAHPCDCACHTNNDAVLLVDLGVVDRKLEEWRRELPFVSPFYAIKCNPDPGIVRALARRGCNFDCASAAEMKVVTAFISKLKDERARRIVYANPSRVPRDLAFAIKQGVDMLVVDNFSELEKVHAVCPEARVIIRIGVPNECAVVSLADKYGINAWGAMKVMRRAKEIGADIAGFSFHVGSGATDATAWRTSIAKCAVLFAEGRALGMHPRIVDIGGGFPGHCGVDTPLFFHDIAVVIRDAVHESFKIPVADLEAGGETFPCELCPEGVTFIAEPGRFMVARSGTLAARVINVRRNDDDGDDDDVDIDGAAPVADDDAQSKAKAEAKAEAKAKAEAAGPNADPKSEMVYYVADGCYGTLSCILMDHAVIPPLLLGDGDPNAPKELSVVFGPTCDGLDKITPKPVPMPRLKVHDWLRFENLGAYTTASATSFNGIEPPRKVYIRSVVKPAVGKIP